MPVSSKPALENVKEFLFRRISELGWAPPEQLEELACQELGVDPLMVHQALRFLVRQDYVTFTQGPDGRKGYEVLPPAPKGGKKNARYGHWSPITRVAGTFLSSPFTMITNTLVVIKFLGRDPEEYRAALHERLDEAIDRAHSLAAGNSAAA